MAPEILYGIGALILLAALIYGTVHKRSRAQKQIGDAVVKKNYREENAESKAEGNG